MQGGSSPLHLSQGVAIELGINTLGVLVGFFLFVVFFFCTST